MPGTNNLSQYQSNRRLEARARVLSVLSQIESELAQHGYYCDPSDPDKHMRLTIAEVLRRAGLSEGYLRNKRHKELENRVKDWLKDQKRASARTKSEARKVKRDTISYLELALSKATSEVQALLVENNELRKEIDGLKSDIRAVRGDGNVVGITSRNVE